MHQLLDDKNHSRRLQSSRNLSDDMGKTFGEKLQQWRESAHISQAEFARRLNVSPTYISNLERDFSPSAKGGKPRPSVKLCIKIAKVLGVPEVDVKAAAFEIQGLPEVQFETVEETLRNAHFFHAKGLSDADLEVIRPILEALDKQIERLAED